MASVALTFFTCFGLRGGTGGTVGNVEGGEVVDGMLGASDNEEGRASGSKDPAFGFNRGWRWRVGAAATEHIDEIDDGNGISGGELVLAGGIGTVGILEVIGEVDTTEYV